MKWETVMLKKIFVYALFFCILSVFPLNAANVSFVIMENGLPARGPAGQYSTMWENGFFDVFYELGHIISNVPIMRLYEKPDDNLPYEAERDFEEAKNGGMDYFIVAIVNYPPTRGTEIPKPQNVVLRLFNTKSEIMIYEQIYSDTKPKSAKEDYESIKQAITEFASKLIMEINLRR